VAVRDIPNSVTRALRQIAALGCVVSTNIMETGETTVVEVTVDSNLPSRWRAANVSPNGVRDIEPIRFEFSDAYPLIAPKIYLRPDFDRCHPHIQPGRPGSLPEPCLLAGSPDELLRTRGIVGLVQQLESWLEKAASIELIDPKQGWEPVRRDFINDVVIADVKHLFGLPKKDGGATSLGCRYTRADNTIYTFVLPHHIKIDGKLKKMISEEESIAIVAWSGRAASGGPFIANKYEPEDVTDVESLIMRARRLGVAEFLTAQLGLLAAQLRGLRFATPLPLTVILVARRPFNLIGQDSPLEICPYIIELASETDLGPKSTCPVRIAGHRDVISSDLLRRASGIKRPSDGKQGWTLVGCGSVGSKLAIHLARAGAAPERVFDKSWMSPHNYARHGALAPHFVAAIWESSKARVLADAIQSLGQQAIADHRDIVQILCRNSNELDKLFQRTQLLVVNATGSINVREALCLPHVMPMRPRAVESCLIGGDRLAYLSIEGPDANPSSMELAVECYQLLLENKELGALAFSPAAEVVTIGQGCSSLTFPMTDARLSALTAPMAERLLDWIIEGPSPDQGEVLVGVTPEDGLGQTWLPRAVEPWLRISDESGIELHLNAHCHRAIESAVSLKPGVETGGVLIGRWSDVTNAFYVVDVLPAPPDSKFSRAEFNLGVTGLTPAIDAIVEGTAGALYAVGTWHNHLVNSGPSSTDKKTADLLASQQLFPAVLLIHTPQSYRFLCREVAFHNDDPMLQLINQPDAEKSDDKN